MRLVPALLVLLPCAASAIAIAAPARFPVYLRDGRLVESAKRPLTVYGRVGIYDSEHRLTWMPASEVDLQRSRAEWDVAAGRAALDTDSLMGRRLFPIAFVDDGGTKRSLPFDDVKWTFVEIWHPY